MARVICTLHNASESISGVAFEPCTGGMLSEEIEAAAAERFLRIPGYRLADPGEADPGEADPGDEQAKPRGRGRPRKAQPEGDAA